MFLSQVDDFYIHRKKKTARTFAARAAYLRTCVRC
jgi:hypothetical protein